MNNISNKENAMQVAAAVLLGVAAISGYMALPYLVGLLSDKLNLGPQQSGLLVSADMIGICLISLVSPFWLNRFNWSFLSPIALLVVVAGNAFTAYINSFELLIFIRVISGLAGGIVFTQGMVFLATGQHTERNIGLYSASATGWMCLSMVSMPILAENYGTGAALLFLSVVPLICSLGLLWWPRGFMPDRVEKKHSLRFLLHKPSLLSLLCFLFFMANIGILWGFVERIGSEKNFPSIELGQVIAFSTFVSIGGGLMAAWLGNRFGHFKPLTVALLIQISCLITLTIEHPIMSLGLFTVLLSIYFLFWNFIDVFQISVLVDMEPSGQAVGLVPAFSAIGSAFGPLVATSLMWGEGFRSVPIIAAGMCVLTILLYSHLLFGSTAGEKEFS